MIVGSARVDRMPADIFLSFGMGLTLLGFFVMGLTLLGDGIAVFTS